MMIAVPELAKKDAAEKPISNGQSIWWDCWNTCPITTHLATDEYCRRQHGLFLGIRAHKILAYTCIALTVVTCCLQLLRRLSGPQDLGSRNPWPQSISARSSCEIPANSIAAVHCHDRLVQRNCKCYCPLCKVRYELYPFWTLIDLRIAGWLVH